MQKGHRVKQTDNRVHITGASDMAMLLGGIVIGATLMYIFDPQNGRRRRATLSDQLTSKVNHLSDDAAAKARDLRNRAQGVIAEAGAAFRRSERGSAEGAEDGRGKQNATSAQQISATAVA